MYSFLVMKKLKNQSMNKLATRYRIVYKSCILLRHYGFVIYAYEYEAETAAGMVNGTVIHGGKITARGPSEQRRRGYSGEYTGKIGHVPKISDDKRKYADCVHYVNSVCNNGSSVSRHALYY